MVRLFSQDCSWFQHIEILLIIMLVDQQNYLWTLSLMGNHANPISNKVPMFCQVILTKKECLMRNFRLKWIACILYKAVPFHGGVASCKGRGLWRAEMCATHTPPVGGFLTSRPPGGVSHLCRHVIRSLEHWPTLSPSSADAELKACRRHNS